MKKIFVFALVLAFLSGCGRPPKETTLTIIGSDTMVNLMQAWAEEFMKLHADYYISVTGGGSGTGIAGLINNTCSIASVSRKMKGKEIKMAQRNGVEPVEFVVGLDGIAVVVNPENTVNGLTVEQLSDIYTGRIKDWKDVGGKPGEIVVLSREVNSGTYIYFKERIVRKGKSDSKDDFASSVLLLSSSQAIADEISGNENAIGYYGMGYINPKQKPLKVAKDLQSGFFSPDNESVVSGKYPISRPLFLYTGCAPEGIVKEFMDFALSQRGQEIVKETDFVPIK